MWPLRNLAEDQAGTEFTLVTRRQASCHEGHLHRKVHQRSRSFTAMRGYVPAIDGKMARIQDRSSAVILAEKSTFLSITVDSDQDTRGPQALRRAHKANPAGWRFLTGTSAEIRVMALRNLLQEKPGEVTWSLHVSNLARRPKRIAQRAVYGGIKFDPDENAARCSRSLVRETKTR